MSLDIETPAEADRRVLHDRRRNDRGDIDRRSGAGGQIYIGSIGAAARELKRGNKVTRGEATYWLLLPGTPDPLLVRKAHGHEYVGWRLDAEDLLANDWCVAA